MARLSLILAALPALLQNGARAEEGHGAHWWEWAGVFELKAGETYTWSAERGAEGAYADPKMKLAIVQLPAGAVSAEIGEEIAEDLDHENASEWETVTSGSTTTLGSGATSLSLNFDAESWVSLFRLKPATSTSYAFYAEHFPTEFENRFHFLKDEHGEDIEPLEGEHHDEGEGAGEAVSSLGTAVGGAILTGLPALIAIALVGPAVSRVNPNVFNVMNSFASGVIFAAAVFLLLPEGLYLAGSGHKESVAAATWGVAFMVGWLVGVVAHLVGHAAGAEVEARQAPAAEGAEGGQAAAPPSGFMQKIRAGDKAIDWAVVSAVSLGDAWHNLVDGMVIGFSAKFCSSTAFWAVVGATVAHEFPQEVADFIILTTKGNLHWLCATIVNACAALPSVIIGAVLAYSADLSSNWQGILLAFGGGTYVFVSCTELASSIMEGSSKNFGVAAASRLVAFAVGATCLGLILIDHAHCEPVVVPAGGDPHAGHNH